MEGCQWDEGTKEHYNLVGELAHSLVHCRRRERWCVCVWGGELRVTHCDSENLLCIRHVNSGICMQLAQCIL